MSAGAIHVIVAASNGLCTSRRCLSDPVIPRRPLEDQGAVIFGQIKHSLRAAISTTGQTKEKGIYN